MKEDSKALQKEFTDFDSVIQNLAVAVTQQQGLQFNSLEEANEHATKTAKEIHHQIQETNIILKEGLQILSEQFTGLVSDVSKKLHDQLHSPENIAKIISTELQDNEHALSLFSEAVNSFYDCGDYHRELCVLSVFLMLFPVYPQPYACYATLIWRKDGIKAAATFYEQLVGAMDNPVLDYFAADCFLKSGNKVKAKELVQRALSNVESTSGEHGELQEQLLQLLNRCG